MRKVTQFKMKQQKKQQNSSEADEFKITQLRQSPPKASEHLSPTLEHKPAKKSVNKQDYIVYSEDKLLTPNEGKVPSEES